jgi:hypothetical protein
VTDKSANTVAYAAGALAWALVVAAVFQSMIKLEWRRQEVEQLKERVEALEESGR